MHPLQTPILPTPEIEPLCRFVQFPYLVSCKTLHAPSTLNNFDSSFNTITPRHPQIPTTQQSPKSSLGITAATTGSGALCPLLTV